MQVPRDIHPLELERWLQTPSPDLPFREDPERALSPREWLCLGYPPEEVAKLPNPDPSRLAGLVPPLHVLATDTRLFRIYFQAGHHPARWNEFRTYGPTSNRFDPHEEPPRVQTRGILYAALEATTCYAVPAFVIRLPFGPKLVELQAGRAGQWALTTVTLAS